MKTKKIMIKRLSENISNTISPNLLYKDLVILLGLLLPRLAPDGLVTVSTLF